MSLKIGIVGLPNVGKSTLFNALTRKKVDIANYPFSTIEPNVGVVEVPDERIHILTRLSQSKKVIPAAVEFVDIAGLMKGAAEGEGLGNKFLSHIREVDTIAEVVRIFEDKDIIHVGGATDPFSDIEVLEYELILKDLETVSRRLDSIEKEVRAGKKGVEEEKEILENFKKEFEGGRVPRNLSSPKELQLLTSKPLIYILNASENQIQSHWKPDKKLLEKIDGNPYVVICAKIESDLAELSSAERDEYLRALGQEESGLDQLIKVGYETLRLITFFTTGEDETRAWTIPKGSRAPRAGRAIHSDFEEKFIRAEVINWQKLTEAGSIAKAREQGFLRTEGKEYVVNDGDVIEFKI